MISYLTSFVLNTLFKMRYTLLSTLLALPLAQSLNVASRNDAPKDASVVDPQFLGFAIEVGSLTDYTGALCVAIARVVR